MAHRWLIVILNASVRVFFVCFRGEHADFLGAKRINVNIAGLKVLLPIIILFANGRWRRVRKRAVRFCLQMRHHRNGR
uniref:Putative secreted peptide n=1 Tax=Anopheles braziliensis TaxID=58242 RepID=A0A2M3ZW89_9DIPT